MLAIGLALLASMSYGVSDFLGGRKTRTVPLTGVLLTTHAIGFIVLLAVVLPTPGQVPDARHVLLAVLAGISETTGVATLYRGLATGSTNTVAGTAALAPALQARLGTAHRPHHLAHPDRGGRTDPPPTLTTDTPPIPRPAPRRILIVSADAMFAFASTRGPLGVIAVLSSLYPLVTVTILLARTISHERQTTRQSMGAAMTLVGAATLAGAG